MNTSDFLWGMYQEHVTHARQHEDQRERMTGAIAALAAAVLAIYASGGATALSGPWAGMLLIVLGLYGVLFSLKHYERFRRHVTFAAIYRNHLEEALPDVPEPGGKIRDRGDERHSGKGLFRFLSRVRLHWLWAGLPGLIAIGGILLIIQQ